MTILTCPAKVTLFLAIHGKDDNGYHLVETVMARHNELQDFIHLEEAENLELTSEDMEIDENNTILKAIHLLEEASGRSLNYRIRLEKHIPAGSGLGGGSSDAAAIMTYLNEKEGLGFSHVDLVELGAKVGMDVPFFISGSPVALCTHYGEEITGLPNLPQDLKIELQLTENFQATDEAYKQWDKKGTPSKKTSQGLQQALLHEDASALLQELHNDFQTIFPLPPTCSRSETKVPLLSGSGGAYAVFHVRDTQKSQSQE